VAPRSRTLAVVALVAVHVLAAAAVLVRTDWTRRGFVSGDSLRYRAIARAGGWPYRDHAVEFPPVAWLAVKLVAAWGSPTTTATLLVLTQLAADLATAASLAWAWGRRAALTWLALLLPLCWDGWIFARIDLLSVGLATAGLALVWRGRPAGGGALIGTAALVKAWAVTLVPGLAVVGRRVAATGAAVTVAAVGVSWLAVGGLDGVGQVVTFRGATGWQLESTVGALVHLFGDARPRGESGAWRIGVQPGWTKPVLAIGLVAVTTLGWWLAHRAHRRSRVDDPAFFHGAVIAVVALLVLAPILSPQYLVWLLPFVAVLWRDRTLVALTAIAVVTTAVVAYGYTPLRRGELWLQLVLVGRNALLVVIGVVTASRLLRAARAERTGQHRTASAA
jgi:hypothetical protein